MTWGMFFLGLIAMIGGFVMVWRSATLEQWLGEVGYLLGFSGDWMTWKTAGIFFLILGFLLATGLFTQFFSMFFGGLFLLDRQ